MLIIPLRSESARRRFPWVVLCLIVLNPVVFSAQFDDGAKVDRAERFYRESVLYAIEPDLYRAWLGDHAAPGPYRRALQQIPAGAPDADTRELLAQALQDDGNFLNALDDGRLLARGSPQRAAWEPARREFESRLRASLVYSGAFIPREHRAHTFVTSMFLHADPLHLIGNMVFLWLAGMLLEPLLGGGVFLAVYFVTGLVSCAGSWLVSPGSAMPELGASGAISGVMGALAAVYGSRRVPCLVSIGLHAWRTSLQGYWLAVIWIAWELVQWVLFPSNVNHMAHLGGLVSGALLGVVARRRAPVEQRAQASVSDREPKLRERAKRLAADMNFEGAARTMLPLAQLTSDPADWELLWAYARHVPQSAAGREARQAIVAHPLPPGRLRTTLLQLQAEVRKGAVRPAP